MNPYISRWVIFTFAIMALAVNNGSILRSRWWIEEMAMMVKDRESLNLTNHHIPRQQAANRSVDFFKTDEVTTIAEMYSGMWWQNKEDFLSNRVETITSLEDTIWKAFDQQSRKQKQQDGSGAILMTRDWLDLNVEHLSKYVKLIESTTRHIGGGGAGQSNPLVDGLAKILTKYIDNSQQVEYHDHHELAVHSTLALVPFKASPSLLGNELVKLELAATLASLWKAGIARAVVVGVSEAERSTFVEINKLLQPKLNASNATVTMELAYIQKDSVTAEQARNVPKLALMSLRTILMNSTQEAGSHDDGDEVQLWLGQDPGRWKHVYFTEPDLLLHLRPSALPAITQQLEQGKLIAGHRLEPLPHVRDFDQASLKNLTANNTQLQNIVKSVLLPDIGVLSAIHRMDAVGDDDVCCDQGRYYPANRNDPNIQEAVRRNPKCGTVWHQCGFERHDKFDYENHTVILEAHHRLLGYPLFALETGTGMPLVGSHQRVCVPRKGPTANCAAAARS